MTELVEQSGLLHAEGTELVVDPTFLALAGPDVREPNPAWLRAAAEEMAAAGEVIGATDLALAAGAVEDAEKLLGAHETRLLQTASAGDLDRWLEAVGERSPALGARLAALRARLSERMAAAAQPAPPGSRERRAPLIGRLASGLATVRALSALASLAVFGLGWVLPLPEGLERAGLVTLGAIIATVPLLVANVLPDYIVMLFLTLALVLPGLVPPADILGGFAAPAWLMIFTLLAVGVAVSRSGLMFRLVLLSLQRLPPRFIPQSMVLCLTGVLMSAGLTSGSTRIALGVPIARGITDAMGFEPRSPGAAAVGLMTFFTFLQLGELFQTGTFTGLVVHDLLPAAAKSEITWWRWFFIALPPFVGRRRGHLPVAPLPLQASPDRAGQPRRRAAPAGAPGAAHPERDLERHRAGRAHRGVRESPVPRDRPRLARPRRLPVPVHARRAGPVGVPGRRDARAPRLRRGDPEPRATSSRRSTSTPGSPRWCRAGCPRWCATPTGSS